jgi:dihydrolipoamide dehydrogenase
MKDRSADVAIIGSGTAAMNARRAVEKAGGTPLMIESGHYGTMCARVGCMPSKLLIAAADAAHEVATASQFGIEVDQGWRVNGPEVLARVRAERDRFVGGVLRQIDALPDEHLLKGHARFVGPTTLEVDDHTRITARAIVIATGSTPVIPPPFAAIREQVLINDDVFELADLPRSLAVIGTGIIGLELGQAMQRLGVATTFFGRSNRLGHLTDPAIIEVAGATLQDTLDLRLNTTITDASVVDEGIRLHFADTNGNEVAQTFEKVLVAAGRKPNLANLGLAASGLHLNNRGLPDWNANTTQCGTAPIFMAGDVTSYRPLLHEASDEGRIAGANAMAFPDVSSHERRTPLAIAFTDPQMALVGQPYDGLRAELDHDNVEIGEVSFARQGRASVMGRAAGLLRVYGDRDSCTVVGAELFGPRAEHLAHLLAWIVHERVPLPRVLEMPVYHPVLEEGLRTALRDLAHKLEVTGRCREEDFAHGPGD